MKTTTDQLAEHFHSLSQQSLNSVQQTACRARLLDYIGCTLAGAGLLQTQHQRYLDVSKETSGSAVVFGMPDRSSAETAALLNGMSAHVAELDDGDRFGMVHPGAPVISAVLATVQTRGLNFDDVIRGIYVGYEACVLLARILQPHLKDLGYHATGTCGTLGAAIGVASACRFDASQFKTALSAATTSTSGILKVIRGASQLKPFNAGQAALKGVVAAKIAETGLLGPTDVMEDSQGFFSLMTQHSDLRLNANLKALDAVQQVYTKPYAACRHCHGPIEAALQLRQHKSFSIQDIAAIRVTTHRYAVYLHDHTDIENSHSAKMSVPYSVAVALVSGIAGLQAFEAPWLEHDDVKRLTRCTTLFADEALTAQVPDKRVAILEIETRAGTRHTAQVDLPKGEPENPINPDELLEKFLSLTTFAGYTQTQAAALAQSILEDTKPNMLFTG